MAGENRDRVEEIAQRLTGVSAALCAIILSLSNGEMEELDNIRTYLDATIWELEKSGNRGGVAEVEKLRRALSAAQARRRRPPISQQPPLQNQPG